MAQQASIRPSKACRSHFQKSFLTHLLTFTSIYQFSDTMTSTLREEINIRRLLEHCDKIADPELLSSSLHSCQKLGMVGWPAHLLCDAPRLTCNISFLAVYLSESRRSRARMLACMTMVRLFSDVARNLSSAESRLRLLQSTLNRALAVL